MFNKGICFCNLDKKKEAIEIFNKAIIINQNEPELYLQRGYCYFSLENYWKSIKDFNKAIKLSPNLWETYCRKWACYKALNKEEEAVLEYIHAIELCYLNDDIFIFVSLAFFVKIIVWFIIGFNQSFFMNSKIKFLKIF